MVIFWEITLKILCFEVGYKKPSLHVNMSNGLVTRAFLKKNISIWDTLYDFRFLTSNTFHTRETFVDGIRIILSINRNCQAAYESHQDSHRFPYRIELFHLVWWNVSSYIQISSNWVRIWKFKSKLSLFNLKSVTFIQNKDMHRLEILFSVNLTWDNDFCKL